MIANGDLGITHSYYAATAHPFAPTPALQGMEEADVVVIGGGFTGLSAALSAAERGHFVILLEAGRIGWGASGRNGGQAIPGWRKSAAELVKLYGEARARDLFKLSLEGRALALERIAKHNIVCDLRTNGHLLAAVKPSDLKWMHDEVETLARAMDYPHARVLTRDETRSLLASDDYHGAFLDGWGGHMHPLNFALGLGEAARKAGVRIFEHSAALSLDTAKGVTVHTAQGEVRAKHGVLACDALLGHLEPRIAGRIMPVANYIVATAPLDNPEALIADALAVSDTRFVVNYFRISADKRLIFGGGERYTRDPPHDIAAFVRPFMLKIFPQLADTPIEHAWGGLVSITLTRMPHVGRLGDLFFAHGYSGHGVLMAALAGEALTDAIGGDTRRYDLFASVAPPEFPGGAALRAPLHVLGMLYYAARDRL